MTISISNRQRPPAYVNAGFVVVGRGQLSQSSMQKHDEQITADGQTYEKKQIYLGCKTNSELFLQSSTGIITSVAEDVNTPLGWSRYTA